MSEVPSVEEVQAEIEAVKKQLQELQKQFTQKRHELQQKLVELRRLLVKARQQHARRKPSNMHTAQQPLRGPYPHTVLQEQAQHMAWQRSGRPPRLGMAHNELIEFIEKEKGRMKFLA